MKRVLFAILVAVIFTFTGCENEEVVYSDIDLIGEWDIAHLRSDIYNTESGKTTTTTYDGDGSGFYIFHNDNTGQVSYGDIIDGINNGLFSWYVEGNKLYMTTLNSEFADEVTIIELTKSKFIFSAKFSRPSESVEETKTATLTR